MAESPDLPGGEPEAENRPLGAAARDVLLQRFFGDRAVAPQDAWTELYRLFLWCDRRTGIAHCYESDKSQPGRPWYVRSMAFHCWVAEQLMVPPAELGGHVDWMFRQALPRLAQVTADQRRRRLAELPHQRSLFAEVTLPEPGQDPELREILSRFAERAGATRAEDENLLRAAVEEVNAYLEWGQKRQNLLGEGFEDALAEIMRRLEGQRPRSVASRRVLHELPGFREPPHGEKPRRVDLGIEASDGRRVLVTAKWSVRADREEQFGIDFDSYARMESSGQDFDFVLVTNEFDAARLKSACSRRHAGRRLFDQVVHVCPDAVLIAYGGSQRGAARELPGHIDSGRITSLAAWLQSL
ncbi:MAG: hypothetical protein QOE65_1149 [Solirubrobacteraceae bacterium]|jgi:hypothetical protein|nr:hypothetical protein [Solirubrobacteraceae bacterium]